MGIPRNVPSDRGIQPIKCVERMASVAILGAHSSMVEHESLGCIVASSTLQSKYHSLLHPLSVLEKFIELFHPLMTPFPFFLSPGFIFSFLYCHFKGTGYREREEINLEVLAAIFIQNSLLFKTLNIQ